MANQCIRIRVKMLDFSSRLLHVMCPYILTCESQAKQNANETVNNVLYLVTLMFWYEVTLLLMSLLLLG